MNWLIDPIAQVLGVILEYVDKAVYLIGNTHNTGICIVIFTFIVNMLMFPLTLKQQKTAKLSALMNPEIQAIQAKYKGKKDNASMQKMQLETQAVYDKYGISPFGGCLPLLIQFPILFALFRVIYGIAGVDGYTNYVPSLGEGSNMFLGLNMSLKPHFMDGKMVSVTLILPILCVVTQWLNTKLMQTNNPTNEDTPGASSMKMMNTLMPFMTGVFCFSFPMGVGLYWIAGNIFRCIQAIFVNRHFDKMDLSQIVEKNKGKAEAKANKREEMNQRVAEYSKQRTSNIKANAQSVNTENEKRSSQQHKAPKDFQVNKDIKPGSIAGYANMLSGSNSNSNKKDDK